MLEAAKWLFWRRFPQWMPEPYRREILELSPYLCDTPGQGSPMIVMRKDVWKAGGWDEVPGAPTNRDGTDWIIRQWLTENPTWRPAQAPTTTRH